MPKGTASLDFQSNLGQYQSAIGATAALMAGIGTTTSQPGDDGVANKNFVGMWTKTTAASGDSRGIYWRHYFNGIAGGEVARLWATINVANGATGATVNALHATGSVAAAKTLSGALNAIRATISTATTTPGGTGAAIQLASDFVTSATIPAAWAFLRVTDDGATRLNTLLNLPAASNGTLIATHTTDAMSHSVKCISGSTVFYLMATTTATNRG